MDRELGAYCRKRYPWWAVEARAARARIKREGRNTSKAGKDILFAIFMSEAYGRHTGDWELRDQINAAIREGVLLRLSLSRHRQKKGKAQLKD